MRRMFAEEFQSEHIGVRTKKIVGMVMEHIAALSSELDEAKAEKLASEALKKAGLDVKSTEKGTDALFFMSTAQAAALADLAVAGEEDKDTYKRVLKQNPSYDMALFGRMVASDPSLNYDAAAQVAHSISTHAVHNEFDYFTAVDDRQVEDNAGAGHVGSMEFNSATLYRYATVNVKELKQSLGADTPTVVRGFAEAFIRSMPTGKQNSYANRTLPDLIYVTVRQDQPINLVDAFEQPVVSRDGNGYMRPSEQRLVRRAQQVYQQFSAEPTLSFGVGEGVAELVEPTSLSQLLDELETGVAQLLSEREVN
jgi:CRISPR system Cascade subunit CasC